MPSWGTQRRAMRVRAPGPFEVNSRSRVAVAMSGVAYGGAAGDGSHLWTRNGVHESTAPSSS